VVLTYDELTSDPSRCLREVICPLLDVPPIQPKCNLCKQSTEPLADRVAHYSEVAALLNSPMARLHLGSASPSVRVRAA